MLLKEKDTLGDEVLGLDRALKNRLSDSDRRDLERRRAYLLSGIQGEEEAAYHINFHLKDRPNWAVIHDLRLEWNGRVAQIDHLLIDRVLEVYVVESKNFKTKVRYANGGWERLKQNHWEGLPCPIEQNRRHIKVLKELIEAERLSPTRLGINMPPSFFNVVLVNPSCSIMGNFPSDVRIYRMDSLVTKIREEEPSPLALLRIISNETLREFAVKVASYHRPAKPAAELPAKQQAQARNGGRETKADLGQTCAGCGMPVSKAEASYCRMNKARLGTAALCRKCQALVPDGKLLPVKQVNACCQFCGIEVASRVVDYCRANQTRFSGKILCRKCQREAVAVAGVR